MKILAAKILVALTIGVSGVGPAAAQEVAIAPAQFRDDVAALLRAERPDLCIRVVDEWTLHFGESEEACEHFLAIDNMYREYLSDPGRLEDLQSRLARSGIAIMSGRDMSNFANRLVVVLRPAGYAAFDDRFEVVSRSFAGDLIAVMMLDSELTLSAVNPENLVEHDMSADEGFALAEINLRERMGDVVIESVDGMEVVGAESGLATGLLWLSESCTPQSEGSRALVFDRNTYVMVGQDDEANTAFDRVAGAIISGGGSLSGTILSCNQGTWMGAE